MIGVIANVAAIALGSIIGLGGKKLIPESWNDTILKGMSLISMFIGISGALECKQPLVMVLSIVLGAMLGQAVDLDGRFKKFSQRIEDRINARGGNARFSEGFINASLLFCVGAMAIVGPLDAALKGNNDILFTKSVMDGFTSIILAASFGIGVLCSGVPVFILQGGIFLLAALIAPLLPEGTIIEMGAAGSLLIIALGLNLTKATDIKVLNYTPAIFMPIAIYPLFTWISTLKIL